MDNQQLMNGWEERRNNHLAYLTNLNKFLELNQEGEDPYSEIKSAHDKERASQLFEKAYAQNATEADSADWAIYVFDLHNKLQKFMNDINQSDPAKLISDEEVVEINKAYATNTYLCADAFAKSGSAILQNFINRNYEKIEALGKYEEFSKDPEKLREFENLMAGLLYYAKLKHEYANVHGTEEEQRKWKTEILNELLTGDSEQIIQNEKNDSLFKRIVKKYKDGVAPDEERTTEKIIQISLLEEMSVLYNTAYPVIATGVGEDEKKKEDISNLITKFEEYKGIADSVGSSRTGKENAVNVDPELLFDTTYIKRRSGLNGVQPDYMYNLRNKEVPEVHPSMLNLLKSDEYLNMLKNSEAALESIKILKKMKEVQKQAEIVDSQISNIQTERDKIVDQLNTINYKTDNNRYKNEKEKMTAQKERENVEAQLKFLDSTIEGLKQPKTDKQNAVLAEYQKFTRKYGRKIEYMENLIKVNSSLLPLDKKMNKDIEKYYQINNRLNNIKKDITTEKNEIAKVEQTFNQYNVFLNFGKSDRINPHKNAIKALETNKEIAEESRDQLAVIVKNTRKEINILKESVSLSNLEKAIEEETKLAKESEQSAKNMVNTLNNKLVSGMEKKKNEREKRVNSEIDKEAKALEKVGPEKMKSIPGSRVGREKAYKLQHKDWYNSALGNGRKAFMSNSSNDAELFMKESYSHFMKERNVNIPKLNQEFEKDLNEFRKIEEANNKNLTKRPKREIVAFKEFVAPENAEIKVFDANNLPIKDVKFKSLKVAEEEAAIPDVDSMSNDAMARAYELVDEYDHLFLNRGSREYDRIKSELRSLQHDMLQQHDADYEKDNLLKRFRKLNIMMSDYIQRKIDDDSLLKSPDSNARVRCENMIRARGHIRYVMNELMYKHKMKEEDFAYDDLKYAIENTKILNKNKISQDAQFILNVLATATSKYEKNLVCFDRLLEKVNAAKDRFTTDTSNGRVYNFHLRENSRAEADAGKKNIPGNLEEKYFKIFVRGLESVAKAKMQFLVKDDPTKLEQFKFELKYGKGNNPAERSLEKEFDLSIPTAPYEPSLEIIRKASCTAYQKEFLDMYKALLAQFIYTNTDEKLSKGEQYNVNKVLPGAKVDTLIECMFSHEIAEGMKHKKFGNLIQEAEKERKDTLALMKKLGLLDTAKEVFYNALSLADKNSNLQELKAKNDSLFGHFDQPKNFVNAFVNTKITDSFKDTFKKITENIQKGKQFDLKTAKKDLVKLESLNYILKELGRDKKVCRSLNDNNARLLGKYKADTLQGMIDNLKNDCAETVKANKMAPSKGIGM